MMNPSWMVAITPIVALSSEIVSEMEKPQEDYVSVEDRAKISLLNPSLQKRSIAKIRLKNGIEAYLISDPHAKHSAMSVAVKAGAWNDPADYPGMAHFVEHVLFMGNKSYPEENGYSKYITECAGTYNAFTSTDRTVYTFSVNHDGFIGALDRLAHFFIDPLLCTASIDRELLAVDQEHSKNIENDLWRQWMTLKEIGNPLHPNAGFSTGNAHTLSGIPQDALRTWYTSNYTPDRMRIVVVSPLPSKQLIEHVVSRFSLVQRPNLERTPRPIELKAFSNEQQGAMAYIKPVRDLKELSLVWELPSSFHPLDSDATTGFLCYLLNSPHEGGLIDTLKQAKWIQEGKVGFDRYGDTEIFFSINFALTEEGIRNREKIIEKTFQTLGKIVEETPYERFEEMQRLSLIRYQYQTRQNAFETVEYLAQKMLDEDLSTFPEQSILPSDFAPDLFQELLISLSPSSCSFMLTADPKLSGVEPSRKERWMGAEYAVVPYNSDYLSRWADPSDSVISLPSANPFIPEQLTLVPQDSNPASEPSAVIKDKQSKLYFLKDAFYEVPEIAMIFRIHTPVIDGSAHYAVLTELFCSAFHEKLHPTLHLAKVAGLSASLVPGHHYLQLTLSGYSEKAPKLANILFTAIKNLQISEERFAVLKELLTSSYANASKELPCWQGKELLDHLLVLPNPTQHQKLKVIESLDYKTFSSFCKEVLNQVFVEGITYGNSSKDEAMNLSSQLTTALNAEAFPESCLGKRQIRLLPKEEGPYVVVESTTSMGKAALLTIQQGPSSYRSRAKQLIAGRFLQELFFDRLRTKQQTGYLVTAKVLDVEGQLLQLFLVQSSSYQPQELLARFDLFLDEVNQEFDQLVSQDSFIKTRSMLVQELSLPPENLQGMASRFATLAFEYNCDFAYYPKLVEQIKQLSYDDMKSFVLETLSRNNTRRLAILMEGTLPGKRPFVYQRTAKEEISSLGELESRTYR